MNFFQTVKKDGRWWLVDPQGRQFISKGICAVRFQADRILNTDQFPYAESCRQKYGSHENWRQAAVSRMISLGFNTLGAWSEKELAELSVNGKSLAITPVLNTASAFVAEMNQGGNAWLHGIFPDVFDPRFEIFARTKMQEQCSRFRDNPNILGWFSDNELRWGPDWRGPEELLILFLAMPESSSGRTAAVELLKTRYASIADFNAVWKAGFADWQALADCQGFEQPYGREAMYLQNQEIERQANEADPRRAAFVADCEAFAGKVAERYFSVVNIAFKEADPNHLNLGARFAYVPQPQVLAAAAEHLDVISFNCYANEPTGILGVYNKYRKPCMITEYSFRGKDSGLPNTKGAGIHVEDQTERARTFIGFTSAALADPAFIGYHWFKYSDEPAAGRHPDGEDSNYGIVTITDEPYPELMAAMKQVNAEAEQLHLSR